MSIIYKLLFAFLSLLKSTNQQQYLKTRQKVSQVEINFSRVEKVLQNIQTLPYIT